MTDTTAPTTPSMRMHIAAARPAGRPKEVKVVLPHDMRIKLHSLKLLTGVTIAETIETALTYYFEHAAMQPAAEGLAPGAPPADS